MRHATPRVSPPFIVPNMSNCAPFETSDEPLSTPGPPTPTYATMMLAPTDMQKQPSPTTNLRCACDCFCDAPWPCLHMNSPHVCKRLSPTLFPRSCVRFRDPPWPCLQVNSNHVCESELPPMFPQTWARGKRRALASELPRGTGVGPQFVRFSIFLR